MSKTMRQIIGQNIRERRKAKGLELQELGMRVGELVGNKRWASKVVASQAERGERAFTAEELAAIAHVLGVRMWTLFLIDPSRDARVNLGGQEVEARLLQPLGDIPDPDSVANRIVELRELQSQFTEQAEAANAKVEAAQEQLVKAMGALGEAHADTETHAEAANDVDWMMHQLYRDVAQSARGSSTRKIED